MKVGVTWELFPQIIRIDTFGNQTGNLFCCRRLVITVSYAEPMRFRLQDLNGSQLLIHHFHQWSGDVIFSLQIIFCILNKASESIAEDFENFRVKTPCIHRNIGPAIQRNPFGVRLLIPDFASLLLDVGDFGDALEN